MESVSADMSAKYEKLLNYRDEVNNRLQSAEQTLQKRNQHINEQKIEFSRCMHNLNAELEGERAEKKRLSDQLRSEQIAAKSLVDQLIEKRAEVVQLQTARQEDIRMAQKAVVLDRQLDETKAQLFALQKTIVSERETSFEEQEQLHRKLNDLETCFQTVASEREDLSDELSRLRMALQEAVASKMEASKLQELCWTEVESLTRVNAELVGHGNINQRIKIHLRVKEENNALKLERSRLTETLRQREEQIRKMEFELRKLQEHPAASTATARVRVLPTVTPSSTPGGVVAATPDKRFSRLSCSHN